jgi:sucrose phosphorylase
MQELTVGKHSDFAKIEEYVDAVKTIHSQKPDYTKLLFEISSDARQKILEKLSFLYGEKTAQAYLPELERVLQVYYAHKTSYGVKYDREYDSRERFSEKDVILITYGDLLKGDEASPLATLAKFCDSYLEGNINTLHILPFFPYSSDRGFSIVDFETVDPHLGTWEDIAALEDRYQLMFDGVINHVSSQSRWFQEFINGNPNFWDFFIHFVSREELTPEQRAMIFRPRTTDILTEFLTINGTVYVWTTFSKDQIDLNYTNPDVLLQVLEILLKYVRHGASVIRLDAVTYLWAEPGTRCVHLDQTHTIIKLFRDILNLVAPRVALITETNVPHEENISYFGNGYDEAQMVYNFALPPLVLYTFYAENTKVLSEWAKGLKAPSETTTFFNFLDSHDGIGVMAVKNILKNDQIDFIIKNAQEHGGFISYKTGDDGDEVPYEINITWFSALNFENGADDIAFQVKRFVASRVIAMALAGVPGIYLHSLIGTRNDIEAVMVTNSKRDINRRVISYNAITCALEDPLSKISRINRELGRLITIRTKQKAFHPNGAQTILMVKSEIFSVLREAPDGSQRILTLTNVSNRVCQIEIPLLELGTNAVEWFDLVSRMEWLADNGKLYLTIQPYDVIWLTPQDRSIIPSH